MINLAHIYQYLRSTDGVNQFQRSLTALNPRSVGFDERRKSDFFNFIRALSKQVNYYRDDNTKDGDWSPFFDVLDTGNRVLVRSSTVVPLPPVKYDNGLNGVDATLTALSNGALPSQDGILLADGDLLLVTQQTPGFQNGVYVVKQGSGASKFVLTRSVDSDQGPELVQQEVEVSEGDINESTRFIQKTLDPVVGNSDLNYIQSGASREDWSPHIALLLSFLHINSIVQQDMNQLTGRHLRHYYEKVLRLKRRAAIADQVHVIFEAVKNAPPVLLPAGARLDAGKTLDGKPRQYAMDSEMVVNHALVDSMKSSYADVNSAGKFILFEADDAKKITGNSTTGAWRPFGRAELNTPTGSRTMAEAQVGFAIASPALLLAEGERSVKITFDLQNIGATIVGTQPFSHVFDIKFTGDKEWISPMTFTAEIETSKLILTSTFPVAAAPISPYNEAMHGAGYKTPWPVCRCFIKPDAFELERLADFSINNITIEVGAIGVKTLVLQNDDSVQPAGKPSLPFGSIPVLKNNFYIGSKEIFSKSIQSFKLYLEWQDLPPNFNNYYQGYDNPGINEGSFKANLHLLAGRSWNNILQSNEPIFNIPIDPVKTIEKSGTLFTNLVASSGYKRDPAMQELTGFTPTTSQGFIKLVLVGPTQAELGNLPAYAPFEAFGHKSFPLVFTQKAIELSQGNPVTLPNPPYVPTLKSVALDYTAKESFIPFNPNGIDQFLMLDFFGFAETKKNEQALLIPQFPQHGALYIGLKNATPPQTVSFLFQVESGTVPGAELLNRSDMHWSYLAGNQWQPLASEDILEDATDAMQKPGIVRLNLGANATSSGYLMPAGLHWIRLTVDQQADGAAALIDVRAQAARGTLITANPDAIEQLIPAKTISKLVNKVSAIKSVTQDYPSFNGVSIENDVSYFRRVSERVRHRNRASAGWDYERIVLEAFPGVFKVKCLPHTDINNIINPGNVKLVVVPDMRVNRGGDLLQPKDNLASLRQIETYLIDNYLGAFVKLEVVNPEYETLLVDCKVTFLPGFDPGFYTNQLQEDIRRFLSPWAFEEGKDIIFGGKVYKSEILAFVEGRPYVDFVVNFNVYHRFEGDGLPGGIGCMTIGDDFIVGTQPVATIGSIDGSISGAEIGVDFVIGEPVEVAIATRPDAILVSNSVHRIEALQAGGFVCSGVSNLGIGQMIIGLDFIPIS